ncbi:MAG: carbon storage regulator [Planctomycetaceae bacterium]
MLVLARKLSESILVGDDVRITVVQVRPGRVRLGIEAPPHVRIRRQEIAVETDAKIEFGVEVPAGAV